MNSILFQKVLNNFLLEKSKTTNIHSLSHRLLVVDLPSMLSHVTSRNDLYIKGSEGTGNRTDYPWVCIMNRKLTTSPQKSIYIAYLFEKNMNGFYLTLNQGITFFEQTYKKEKYNAAKTVADYFKQEITGNNFSRHLISLGGIKGDNGYGFEQTTILSKYYVSNTFDSSTLENDLIEMLKIYDEVVNLLYPRTYEQAVLNILESPSEVKVAFEEAEKEIELVLRGTESQSTFLKDLLEVQPNRNKVKRLKKLTIGSDKKTDYIKKAHESARTGLVGEELVLQFEKNKLLKLGYDHLVEQIKWISKQTDMFGYDIESLEVLSNGEIKKIYIEVKTTISKYDTDFYVSANEVSKSEVLNQDYYLYRVFDCDSPQPQMYRLKGKITDNFHIDPLNFVARLKL
jgi:hypothetical protein